jgi:hypothetical protein
MLVWMSRSGCDVMDKSRPQLEAHGQGWFGSMTSIRSILPTAAQKRTSILVSLALPLILGIISLFLQAARGSCSDRGVINPNSGASGRHALRPTGVSSQRPVTVPTRCATIKYTANLSLFVLLKVKFSVIN